MAKSFPLFKECRLTIAVFGVPFLFAASPLCAHAQVANTLAFYDFNDGTAKDNSGNGNNGILGSPAPTATASGLQGGGFRFNASDNGGAGDTFTAPINLSPSANPELTFGGWFLLSGTVTPNVGLISSDTGGFKPTLDIDTRGNNGAGWSLFTGNGVLSTGVAATTGVWTFVAGVYDQTNGLATLYVDPSGSGTGLVSASAAANFGTGQQGLTSATVGRNPNYDNAFNGSMDNIFFVGSALTQSQIQNIDTKGQAAFLGSAASGPEPGSLALSLSGGLSLVGLIARRRAKARLKP